MKKITLLFIVFSYSLFGNSQLISNHNVSDNKYKINDLNEYIANNYSEKTIEERYYKFVEYNAIPSQELKDIMKNSGMRFLEYVSKNTYLVSFPATFSKENLNKYLGARSKSNNSGTY